MLPSPKRTTLAKDPTHRTHAINGYAFQQDAIHTFNNWQYACFYASLPPPSAQEPLFVHLSRRKLPDGPWETLVFDDYAQTVDDGHNTVQLGICPGDGTIHLSYDHHCDILRYRHSRIGVATSPESIANWGPELFTSTLSMLPGLSSPEVKELLSYITYPRFVTRGQDLLFTFRTGKAGLGDDHLCVYTSPSPSSSGTTTPNQRPGSYKFLGTHLKGQNNNPYINGLDVSPIPIPTSSTTSQQRLTLTWVYREFIPYPGWDDPTDTKHKSQSGPNAATNNRDLCHAWSDDGGLSWASSSGGDGGQVIATLDKGESIKPTSPGIIAFVIPKGSGLMNQEAQAVDYEGGVHVLNRDCLDAGVQRWKHYYLSPHDKWIQRPLPYVEGIYGGKRGQLAINRDEDLYFVLPHHKLPILTILKATKASQYADYQLVWRGEGFPPTEPLVDKARLVSHDDNVLSVFTRAFSESGNGSVDVVVLDFQL